MNTEEKCKDCNTPLTVGVKPVTLDGVYGDYEVQWGKVGGVHTSRRVRVNCQNCGADYPLEWPFDD